MKTKLVLVLTAIVLVGCGGRPGGLKDAMAYDAKSLTHVKMPDDVYRVFEHPAGDRIMTTTSIGKAAGQGFVKGATLGLATVQTPEQLHEAAARKYLDDTGRSNCTIRSGYELVTPQYEFKFDCANTAVQTNEPATQSQPRP